MAAMVGLPERIGRYRVREVIGAGAFATVYRARDDHLDTDVAVKVLAENHSLDPDIRQRFIEEGRRLRRVRSPHVVAVHDLDDTERAQPYLVLEWADRGDLASRVAALREQGRRPGPADALTVARMLAAALRVLHRHQLVHRDLAPSNLLLTSTGAEPTSSATAPAGAPTAAGHAAPPDAAPAGAAHNQLIRPYAPPDQLVRADERLVLSDLGLVKDLARASGLTVAAGTSGFAPPEQRGSGQVDQRSDVWAASALLVWLAIDCPPGDSEDWRRELRWTDWPEAVVPVLARGLASRPERRHSDIDQWIRALEAALGTAAVAMPAAAAGTDSADAVGASAGAGRRRFIRAAAPVAAALLLGGLIGGVVADQRTSDSPSVRTTQLAGGNERTEVEEHGIIITVEGPARTSVGEPVDLAAEVSEEAVSWLWIGPDGLSFPDEQVLHLEPETPGRATVRLLAFDDQNRRVELTRTLEVSG